MAAVNKISSNDIDLAFAEEDSIKALPVTPDWYAVQANTVTDFGGNVTKTPREFLTSDRQRRKGQTTDLEAAGSMNHDLVQEGLQRLLQGFFFADFRYKAETGGMGDSGVITSIGASNDYTRTTGSFVDDGYEAGDLVYVTGFALAANNGLKTVDTVAALTLTVSESLTADASPSGIKIVTSSPLRPKATFLTVILPSLAGGFTSVFISSIILFSLSSSRTSAGMTLILPTTLPMDRPPYGPVNEHF